MTEAFINSFEEHFFSVFVRDIFNHDSCSRVLSTADPFEIDAEIVRRPIRMLAKVGY